MLLVCSTDIAISDGTFGGFVLALSTYLYLYSSLTVSACLCVMDPRVKAIYDYTERAMDKF